MQREIPVTVGDVTIQVPIRYNIEHHDNGDAIQSDKWKCAVDIEPDYPIIRGGSQVFALGEAVRDAIRKGVESNSDYCEEEEDLDA